MRKFFINQLYLSENSHTILPYLKAKKDIIDCPGEFSLNSIKSMPEALKLPLNSDVLSLAKMNLEMPEFDEHLKDLALDHLFTDWKPQKTGPEMQAFILDLREKVRKVDVANDSEKSGNSMISIFEQAVSNFQKYRFFCQYDWRLTHWGTDLDICSVVSSTFTIPTTYIEFETSGLPPIVALRNLADTFPSVRFLLQYRNSLDKDWIKKSIFPSLPFGY
jgi:hypothetical protein